MRRAPKVVLQALPVDVEETKMHPMLDTGCQRTIAGSGWLKQARQEFLKRFSLKCNILTESRKFQFGPGGLEMSFRCTTMPIGVAGSNLQQRQLSPPSWQSWCQQLPTSVLSSRRPTNTFYIVYDLIACYSISLYNISYNFKTFITFPNVFY